MGLKPSAADPGLYFKDVESGRMYMLVYVDDILIAARSKADVEDVKRQLLSMFKGTDERIGELGEATFFLAMHILRDRASRTIKLTQKRLTAQLVDTYGLNDCKGKTVPLSTSLQLTKADGEYLDNYVRSPYIHSPDRQPAVPVGLHKTRHCSSRGILVQVHGRAYGRPLASCQRADAICGQHEGARHRDWEEPQHCCWLRETWTQGGPRLDLSSSYMAEPSHG